jgi:hypothetical protein
MMHITTNHVNLGSVFGLKPPNFHVAAMSACFSEKVGATAYATVLELEPEPEPEPELHSKESSTTAGPYPCFLTSAFIVVVELRHERL